MRLSHVLTTLFLLISGLGMTQTQTLYGVYWVDPYPFDFHFGHTELHRIEILNGACSDMLVGKILGNTIDSLFYSNLCHCPDNFLYATAQNDSVNIYKINPQDAQLVSIIPLNDNPSEIYGMTCTAEGKLVASKNISSPTLVEIDPANGNVITLANTATIFQSLMYYDSVWYGFGYQGMWRLKLMNETAGFAEHLIPSPIASYGFAGVIPDQCNELLMVDGFNGLNSLHEVNFADGSSNFVCNLNGYIFDLTRVGGNYLHNDPFCTVPIDLDPNDDSGAFGNDYRSAPFDCKTNHVKIVDQDAWIPSYPIIDTVWASITGGILDPGMEGLFMGLPPTGIAVTGSTTTTILLTNASGTARVSDFLTALKSIQYKDLALSPLGGTREVTIRFSTLLGFPTENAKCFIEVQQLPQVQVNLGPDRSICQGTSTVLDAGNPGHTYYWAGGQTTKTITAINTGTYKVTVSDAIKCPGADEVKVRVIPNRTGSIIGPDFACAGDSVALVFNCNCTDTFDFRLTHNLGLVDTLYNITNGSVLHFYLPYNPFNNLYDLNFAFLQVNTNQATSCIAQLGHRVWVNPSNFTQNNNAFICQGDSINLGGVWQTQPGIYTHTETTPFGCGITINTTLYVGTPGNQTIHIDQATCDPMAAGVFTQNLTNQGGCDSTVITTVSLISSDTVFIASKTCDPDSVGVFTQHLTGAAGCDSTVIITTTLAPEIFVGFQHIGSVCQGDSVGITFDILGPGSYDFSFTNLNTGQVEMLHDISYGYVHFVSPSQSALYWPQQVIGNNPDGCLEINNLLLIDALQPVYTNNAFLLCQGDSVFAANDWQTQTGIYVDSLTTQFGCDSIVTTNLLFNLSSDTVFLASQTCDPTLAGVFAESLTNSAGCDSTIVTTITLLSSDTVFVASQTCDPTLAGVFTENLTNSAGCDSTIVTTITLLSSDTVFIASQTCDPALAGVFTENQTNAAGCDSTIVTTITLLSSDTVFIASQTCDPALAGVFNQTMTSSAGCDSTIVTTITLLSSDTVFIASQTCDPSLTGVFTQNLTNSAGCDSTVVTSVALFQSDTVLIPSQTCDPALAGVFTQYLTNSAGCDSTIVTTVTLHHSDSVYVISQTCDPALVGTSIEILFNQFGCDSTVFSTVTLLPTDTVLVAITTCEPGEVGVFQEMLTNGFGCDSLVLHTISLLPPDSCEPVLRVYAPNAFSPNGDGVNDLFQLYTNEFAQRIQSLQVYSRWGERVYEAYDLVPNDPAAGWDGKFRAKPMDAGTFLFWAVMIDLEGRVTEVKGEVVLLN
ncbi:MAG: gliding motility-associated C-terminal domain-containing protein [Saprospiraceae bacterium]|nr:gliding motility-associated C-terminal domain-containing protein [Saprospiraceae bacterium]